MAAASANSLLQCRRRVTMLWLCRIIMLLNYSIYSIKIYPSRWERTVL